MKEKEILSLMIVGVIIVLMAGTVGAQQFQQPQQLQQPQQFSENSVVNSIKSAILSFFDSLTLTFGLNSGELTFVNQSEGCITSCFVEFDIATKKDRKVVPQDISVIFVHPVRSYKLEVKDIRAQNKEGGGNGEKYVLFDRSKTLKAGDKLRVRISFVPYNVQASMEIPVKYHLRFLGDRYIGTVIYHEDTEPPKASIQTVYRTRKDIISLSLDFSDNVGVDKCRIRNEGENWGFWGACEKLKFWKLNSKGTTKIFFQVKDVKGNINEDYTEVYYNPDLPEVLIRPYIYDLDVDIVITTPETMEIKYCNIDWGDGTVHRILDTRSSHRYPLQGEYVIEAECYDSDTKMHTDSIKLNLR